MKFKVGDQVKVVAHGVGAEHVPIGSYGVIVQIINTRRSLLYAVEFSKEFPAGHTCVGTIHSGRGYYCSEKMLTIVNKPIVIYTDGCKVTALDHNTGCRGIAKCSPGDQFDFNVGARLAFERLMGSQNSNITFKVLAVESYGDFFTKGNVYKFVNGQCKFDSGMISNTYDSFDDFRRKNVGLSHYLIELEERDDPKEILKKFDNIIRVGDKVKIINPGMTYSTYVDWVEKNVRGRDLRYSFDYDHIPEKSHNYIVECIAQHEDTDDMIAYIQDIQVKRCYVIDIKGLRRC